MVLTDELYKIGENSKGICTILNDDYVLVSKSMPITDDKLDIYVENINNAKMDGINIATILDYRLIPDTTCCYGDNNYCYSKGVFLEERAQGVSNDKKIFWLSLNSEYDFREVVHNYFRRLDEYITELENRASVPISYYEKFFEDCLNLNKYDLQIDPKPLNFFFDKNVGYTIIDVVQAQGKVDTVPDGFAECFFDIVFGFGRTDLYVDLENMSYLTEEYLERLSNVSKRLEAMLVKVLRKHGVKEEKIKVAVYRNSFKYQYNLSTVTEEELERKLKEKYYKLKENKKEKNNYNNEALALLYKF